MSQADGSSTAGLSATGAWLLSRHRSEPPPEVAILTVLWHPDARRIGERLILGELARGRTAAVSRREPDFIRPGDSTGRPLQDPYLSRRPIRLRAAAGGSIEIDLEGSRTRLAADGHTVEGARTFTAEEVAAGVVLELAGRIVLLLHRGRPRPVGGGDLGLVGASDGIERLRSAIRDVADLDVSVLLRGETGTGKELAARALHEHGRRSAGPFVAVNLGALAPSLAAAELFGARKGAYTGASRDQAGYFVHAHGGTLFLDEVGEAPTDVQAMLLRALETGEVVPVGERSPRRVDVRVVAATDADLDRLAAQGGFRAPLYHRLAGFEIRLPALRHRRDDFGRLLAFFLRREGEKLGGGTGPLDEETWPWLGAAQVARLAGHGWPGNVRQLRNVARQLAIAGRRPAAEAAVEVDRLVDELVGGADMPPAVSSAPPSAVARPAVLHRSPKEVGEEELLAALRESRWRLKPAARRLGISRTSLYDLIDRCPRIRRASDLGREELETAWRRHEGDLEAAAEALEVSSQGLRYRLRELGLA